MRRVRCISLGQMEREPAFDAAGFPQAGPWEDIEFPAINDDSAYAIELDRDVIEPVLRAGDMLIVSPSSRLQMTSTHSRSRHPMNRCIRCHFTKTLPDIIVGCELVVSPVGNPKAHFNFKRGTSVAVSRAPAAVWDRALLLLLPQPFQFAPVAGSVMGGFRRTRLPFLLHPQWRNFQPVVPTRTRRYGVSADR